MPVRTDRGSAHETVTVLGATRNFFKVGHYTLRQLAREEPRLTLRLAIPDVHTAARAVHGVDLQKREWDPADPSTLDDALDGTDVLLMVPPINDRVAIGSVYLDAARRAGVQRIVCLGIQFEDEDLAMAREVDRLSHEMERSGISYEVVRLPMFLENLLYQSESIATRQTFCFPVDEDASFAFISCEDAAGLFCAKIQDPDRIDLRSAVWTHSATGTCAELATTLSTLTGRTVSFRRQGEREFVDALQRYGMPEPASRQVLGLWSRIESEGDVPATSAASDLLGRPTQGLASWIAERRCCFEPAHRSCPHPGPPAQHMF